VIVPPTTILAPHRIEIGDEVLIYERVTFSLVEEHWGTRYSPHLTIGDRTVVGHSVWFSCVGEIEIGAGVLIGHGVLIADSFHEYQDRGTPIIRQPMAPPRAVRIGAGAHIGPGAVILPGVTIGAGCYVAAGAVVAEDVPPHSVAAGNPAEVIRRWDPSDQTWIDSPDRRWRATLRALSR
jgi:acetyltransferase-like isoleucine patch superfamily enzyme